MACFDSLLIDVLLAIFEQCQSFTDATSLSTTCKSIRSIWIQRRASLAFTIALSVIPAFDEALITIRATEIAKSHTNTFISKKIEGETTPDFRILPRQLSYRTSRPTFGEILSVLDLYSFITTAIYFARHGDHEHLIKLGYYLDSVDWENTIPFYAFPDEPLDGKIPIPEVDTPIYELRIFSSMYRVFLAGAMLSAPYIHSVLSESSPLRDLFLPHQGPRCFPEEIEEDLKSELGYKLTSSEVEYLDQSSVYSHNLAEAPGSEFADFADYLITSGREEYHIDEGFSLSDTAIPRGIAMGNELSEEEYKKGSAVQQIMMFYNAYDIIHRLIADHYEHNSFVERAKGYPGSPETTSQFKMKKNPPEGPSKSTRSIELFMFGIYQPEVFTFPASRKHVKPDSWIYAGPGSCEIDGVEHKRSIIPVKSFNAQIFLKSHQMGHDWTGALVDMDFVRFALSQCGVMFEHPEWYKNNYFHKEQYMAQGRAFWGLEHFVPTPELLKPPLILKSRFHSIGIN
ncbi:hypothetical protein H072_599 [Dactylellina haptotyla CBS 200.50]|uniref:F-box domain-containing protein n=1 Tax=Dactylellina haptotyla (strain CBS 200.50) TaxID=1284197 RepID=S8C0X4_DACHA|nr:hypothetical protein H072_599 [Dactylellina haptotyla CBS 200.50]